KGGRAGRRCRLRSTVLTQSESSSLSDRRAQETVCLVSRTSSRACTGTQQHSDLAFSAGKRDGKCACGCKTVFISGHRWSLAWQGVAAGKLLPRTCRASVYAYGGFFDAICSGRALLVRAVVVRSWAGACSLYVRCLFAACSLVGRSMVVDESVMVRWRAKHDR